MSAALEISDLRHKYGDRESLRGLSFSVGAGDVFALLGPNGGGKSTLFKIICTLLRPTSGTVEVFGVDAVRQPARARRHLGVVFQHPAVDPWLTVVENLRTHAHLYGLRGAALPRVDRTGARALRAHAARRRSRGDAVGRPPAPRGAGQGPPPRTAARHPRRTERRPRPRRAPRPAAGAHAPRDDAGTTIVLTTHLMDEAAVCDRVGILHEGRLVAIGAPAALTEAIGGDVLTIECRDPGALAPGLRDRFGVAAQEVDGRLRVERPRAHEFLPVVVERFPARCRRSPSAGPRWTTCSCITRARPSGSHEDGPGHCRAVAA
jgi:ABC-2 type transport system ATP-binding protein